MSLKDDCARKGCGHAKDTHFPRRTLRPSPFDPKVDVVVVVNGRCTGSWCDCPKYEPPSHAKPS